MPNITTGCIFGCNPKVRLVKELAFYRVGTMYVFAVRNQRFVHISPLGVGVPAGFSASVEKLAFRIYAKLALNLAQTRIRAIVLARGSCAHRD